MCSPNPWLFHFNVWQNSLQIKKNKNKNKSGRNWHSFLFFFFLTAWVDPTPGKSHTIFTQSPQRFLRFSIFSWCFSYGLANFGGEGNDNPLQYSGLENPMDKEPGRLQSMGSRRVRHDWVTSLSLFTFMYWIRKWQPTPVFLPGESQGWRSLVSCHLWGCTESDTTDAT